ncbi:MAG: WG repeat-containing protein [Bacteroidota bacterium]
MRILSFLFVFLCSLPFVHAQHAVELYPFTQDRKWGFVDKSGTVVVPATYDRVHSFHEGLAAVERHQGRTGSSYITPRGNLGYIDGSGKRVIQMGFDPHSLGLAKFSNGRAAIASRGRYGYIDKTGEVVIRPEYETANPFHESLALVRTFDKEVLVIDTSGNVLFSLLERTRTLVDSTVERVIYKNRTYQEGKIGVGFYREGKGYTAVFDKSGALLFTSQILFLHDYTDGVAPATKDIRQNWGYIDAKGELVGGFDYKTVSDFQDGLAVVKSAETGKMGIINRDFEFQVEPTYDLIFEERESNVFLVEQRQKYGYIDGAGNVLIDIQYESAMPFSEGLALVRQEDGTVLCLTKDAELVFSFDPSQEVLLNGGRLPSRRDIGFRDGLAVLIFKGVTKYVDRKGKIVAEH